MKPFSSRIAVALLCGCLFTGNAQVQPHSFGAPTFTNNVVVFPLLGAAPTSVRPFFDIYPTDASIDLHDWFQHLVLVRTNAASTALSINVGGTMFPAEYPPTFFLRTPTNNFITPLPKPTGVQVGVVNRLLTDPSRTNRYNITTNSSFMATIWYPAESVGLYRPAPYVEKKLAQNGSAYFDETANVALFTGFAQPEAPMASGSYPVIIYSHGYPAHRRQNTGKFEELASHGYVVVAVDHEDCFGTVFPDGRFIPGRYTDFTLAEARRSTPGRIADLKFVLDLLSQLNQSDPILAGRLDQDRIGTMGFSHGGNGAAELGRLDSRCRAVALLEAYLYELPELRTNGLPVPLLEMYRASPDGDPGFGNVQGVFTRTATNAYYCQVKNTEHSSFGDLKDVALATTANRRAEEAIRACLVSFFNRHLKAIDDHLLDNPTNAFPVLFKFKSK